MLITNVLTDPPQDLRIFSPQSWLESQNSTPTRKPVSHPDGTMVSYKVIYEIHYDDNMVTSATSRVTLQPHNIITEVLELSLIHI